MYFKNNILIFIVVCMFVFLIPLNVFAADETQTSNFGQNMNITTEDTTKNTTENQSNTQTNQNSQVNQISQATQTNSGDLQSEMNNISSMDVNNNISTESNNSSIEGEFNKLSQGLIKKGYGTTTELEIPQFKTGYTTDIQTLYKNSFGNMDESLKLKNPTMPENFTFDNLVAQGDAIRNAAGADFKNNEMYKNTLEQISIGSTFNLVADKMITDVSLSSPEEMQAKLGVVAAGLNASYESALSTVKSLAGHGGATMTKDELRAERDAKFNSINVMNKTNAILENRKLEEEFSAMFDNESQNIANNAMILYGTNVLKSQQDSILPSAAGGNFEQGQYVAASEKDPSMASKVMDSYELKNDFQRFGSFYSNIFDAIKDTATGNEAGAVEKTKYAMADWLAQNVIAPYKFINKNFGSNGIDQVVNGEKENLFDTDDYKQLTDAGKTLDSNIDQLMENANKLHYGNSK